MQSKKSIIKEESSQGSRRMAISIFQAMKRHGQPAKDPWDQDLHHKSKRLEKLDLMPNSVGSIEHVQKRLSLLKQNEMRRSSQRMS